MFFRMKSESTIGSRAGAESANHSNTVSVRMPSMGSGLSRARDLSGDVGGEWAKVGRSVPAGADGGANG